MAQLLSPTALFVRRLARSSSPCSCIMLRLWRVEPPPHDGARQHVARPVHVRCGRPHHGAQPAVSDDVQSQAGDRERRLHAARSDRTSQKSRLLSGKSEEYCRNILESVAKGKPFAWTIEASDGRIVNVVNTPMAAGGWVATHEDVTEQRKLQQQRDAMVELESKRGRSTPQSETSANGSRTFSNPSARAPSR